MGINFSNPNLNIIPTIEDLIFLIKAHNFDEYITKNGQQIKSKWEYNDFAIGFTIGKKEKDVEKCIRYLIGACLVKWPELVTQLKQTCRTLAISKSDIKQAAEIAKKHSVDLADLIVHATEAVNNATEPAENQTLNITVNANPGAAAYRILLKAPAPSGYAAQYLIFRSKDKSTGIYKVGIEGTPRKTSYREEVYFKTIQDAEAFAKNLVNLKTSRNLYSYLITISDRTQIHDLSTEAEEISTMLGKAYMLNNCHYKESLETNNGIVLDESSVMTPLEKMQALNNGTRNSNIAAMNNKKLRDNQKICIQHNLPVALAKIEAEMRVRGLGPLSTSGQMSHQQKAAQVPPRSTINRISHIRTAKDIAAQASEHLAKILTDDDMRDLAVSYVNKRLAEHESADYIIDTINAASPAVVGERALLWVIVAYLIFKATKNKDMTETMETVINKFSINTAEDIGKILIGNKNNIDAIRRILVSLMNKSQNESLTEDVEKHDELNPKLFENEKLKPEVKDKILEIVNRFVTNLATDEITIKVLDVILVGSNASYNYTKDSDVDIHIIADQINCPEDLYSKVYSAYRSLFNHKFDIGFYGIPVELYVETSGMPRVSNGVYSVKNDAWIREPVQQDIPDIDKEEFESELMVWEDRYQNLKDKKDITEEEIDKYITDIYELRHTALATDGEYSIGNLVFKEVRNKGWLDSLKDLRNETISTELSLEGLDHDNIDESAHQLTNHDLQQYRIDIQRVTHNQPVIQPNGIFEIYNVAEDDANTIISLLKRQNYVADVHAAPSGKYNFNKAGFSGMASRYFTIRGRIKY